MRVGYAASVAKDSLSAGAAERTRMVEVPVGLADGTVGFLTADAHYFKSGKVIVTLPLCNGIPVPQQNGCIVTRGAVRSS